MNDFRAQSNINGKMERPIITVVTNFTKPTETKPSLLTFDEVETFLHEFGHSLHGMLANTVYPSMSGTGVYRDFVELPSQIMENWATEKEWLDLFAVHYKTGEKIPAELVHKLIEARNFQSGYLSERQLSFGMDDMAWHSITKPVTDDVISFEQRVMSKMELFPHVKVAVLTPPSRTSLPVVTRPVTTVTNGPKYSMPMLSRCSRRTVFSIELRPNRSARIFWKKVERNTRWNCIKLSADRSQLSRRCWNAAD